ncbi:putative death-inducer obliterator 1 isoform X2 [Apostichopus japonicus]|uniref:Putative death-inducer obliterator 1 isoform X2 n=1 Tax=Stichopus japonicus TaxID=307972 RepID=A0A2G8JIM3_STIJA|nr:putative death-inducer obliterator 1 isoform X2 [Apostichopus japonicus]
MVKTNLNRKLPVRTSESSKDSMKMESGRMGGGERSTRRSSRHESSHSSKEEKVTSPGFDVSHADHSYAGRTEAPTKVDTTPHRQSESSKREKNAGGREVVGRSPQRKEDQRIGGRQRGKREDKCCPRTSKRRRGGRDRLLNRRRSQIVEIERIRGETVTPGRKIAMMAVRAQRVLMVEDPREILLETSRLKVRSGDLGLVSSEDEASQEEGGDEDTNEGGSEWSEDEDPERLWCICKKPHDSRFMICCDKCEDWFHGSCVNVTKQQGKHMEDQGLEWFCPNCKGDKNSSRKIKEESQPPPDKKKDRESRKEKKEDVKRERRDSIKREKSEDKGSSSSRRLSKDGSKEGREAKGQNVKGGEVKGEELKKEESKRKDTKGKDVKPASTISKETTDVKKRDSSDLVKKKKFTKPPLPKQLCIMTGCDSTAKPNTVYCSNRCILRHAVESLQLLHQEKWFSQGFKRDSSGDVKGRAHCEGDRVPVVEKHTNRLRTGLAAPTPEDLPSWLERHPTYEVLVPTAKKSPPIVTSPTSKTGRDSKDPWKRRESKDHKESSKERRESSKERRESKDVAEKSPVKEVVTKEPKKVDSEKTVERRRSSESEGSKQSGTAQSSSEGVRQNVKKSLSDALCSRDPEEATKTANIIEEALFKLHKDTGMKYKAKYRTLIFNLRDTKNKGLFRRVVQQKIDPAKLVQMSSEQLASKELAQWREREAKHSLEMIVQVEEERKEVPIIKKTHKGEIEVTEADDLSSLQLPGRKVGGVEEGQGETAGLEGRGAGEAGGRGGQETGRQEDGEEETAGQRGRQQKTKGKKGAKKEKKSSAVVKELVASFNRSWNHSSVDFRVNVVIQTFTTSFNLDEYGSCSEKGAWIGKRPSWYTPQTPPTHEKPQKKVKSFWKGFLNMQDVAKFVAAAYHVSGPIDILNELFPDSLEIRGRIPFHTVWDYFNKLKSAGSTELTVLRFHVAHEEDKGLYGNLFNYFSTRERIGVVGGFEKPLIKDFYILPLPSHKPVPENILPFEGPVRFHPPSATEAAEAEQRGRPSAGSKRPLPESSAKTAAKKDEEEKRYLPPVVKRVKSTDAEYVPEGQMSDPIVAQYGNVDPSKMKEEEIEPYSPSQEERRPLRPHRQQYQGDSQSTSQDTPDVDKLNQLLENVSGNITDIGVTEIATAADAASNLTQNLLSSLGDSDLSEQQQLLIQLTRQVEEAKKALLDKQIESLQFGNQ